MVGFTWIKLHLNPWTDLSKFEDVTPADRRHYVLDRLEHARTREWLWAVAVAGIGFLTDAYNIFSINLVLPMIGYVYYENNKYKMPHSQQIAINIATLGGSIVGQVLFGLAADIWGRRKLYGLELIITVAAALGSAMSSEGVYGSMSVFGWLVFWRLILGIGIGADYPLSAVICSEMAPTKLRGTMLTAVFFCQPLGQLMANVVGLIVTYAARDHLQMQSGLTCDPDCQRTLDVAWRLILGLGAVPAAISLWFRMTIIESPRYTAEVVQNDLQAAVDVDRYFESSDSVSAVSIELPRQSHSSSRPEIDLDAQVSAEDCLNNGVDEIPESTMPSWADFKSYFIHQGNYKTLLATALCWFLLDLPFFGLGMNDSSILNMIWSNKGFIVPAESVYQELLANSWQSLLIVTLGSVIGVSITLVSINRLGRRLIQINGFFWLFVLFIVLGSAYKELMRTYRSSAIVVLYILTQIFFNFGPNTTTYIIAAEVFPTRYRCTAHGISAAAGKLGAVIAQCFLGFVHFSGVGDYDEGRWLGNALLVFSAFMLLGLLITVYWIPVSHDKAGRVLTLEELAQGRAANPRR